MTTDQDTKKLYTNRQDAIDVACYWQLVQALRGHLVTSYLDMDTYSFSVTVHHGEGYAIMQKDSGASHIVQYTWVDEETGKDCYATSYDYMIDGQ